MSPKKKRLVIASSIVAVVAAAVSVDYYLFMKPTFIKCEITPIPELPTLASLLIKIGPDSYLDRFESDPRIEAGAWLEKHKWWSFGKPTAFLYEDNPRRELAMATADHFYHDYGQSSAFEYKWGVVFGRNDPDTNHIRIPTQDGHVYTFNEVETIVSREDGSYTEVLRDARASRNPRDEVTVHGTCSKGTPRKPSEQVL
jgi:hypothetical protein